MRKYSEPGQRRSDHGTTVAPDLGMAEHGVDNIAESTHIGMAIQLGLNLCQHVDRTQVTRREPVATLAGLAHLVLPAVVLVQEAKAVLIVLSAVAVTVSVAHALGHVDAVQHELMGNLYLTANIRHAMADGVVERHGVDDAQTQDVLTPDGNHHLRPRLLPQTDILLCDRPFDFTSTAHRRRSGQWVPGHRW